MCEITENDFRELLEKAENGDGKAMAKLAHIYERWDKVSNEEILGNEDDRMKKSEYWGRKAAKILKKEAQNNDSEAALALALLYENGEGVNHNEKTAFYWCEKSAKLGNEKAMLELVNWYHFTGYRFVKNESERKEVYWYKKAAEKGNEKAILGLANFYRYKDTKKAIFWYEKLAETGNPKATRKLGDIYETEYCDTRKKSKEEYFEKAVFWYKKAIALNDVNAMRALGDLYETAQDKENMLYWYEKAANLEYSVNSESRFYWAAEKLAEMYYRGKELLEQDYEKAFFWCNKARENNSSKGEIHYWLFEMYRDGNGVEKNAEEELKCLKTAAMFSNKKAIEEICKRL